MTSPQVPNAVPADWPYAASNSASLTCEHNLCSALQRTIAATLLAALFFATLAHGAVEPWSVGILELMLTAVLFLWNIKSVVHGNFEITIPTPALPIAGLLVLGIAQSLSVTGKDGRLVSLSMDVEATRQALVILFFLLVAFLASVNFLVMRNRLMSIANTLTVFGTVLAVFALIQHFTWNGAFYWVRPEESSGVFGPFVNRNHFAGYMAMLVPIPLALVTQILKGQQRLLYGFAAAIMATAAIVSNSRSGAISLTISMAFMLILGARLRRFRTIADSFRLAKVVPIVLIAVAVVAGVLWVGAGEVVEHFGDAATQLAASGTPDVGRATIWQGALNMIRHHSLLGVGFGAFVTVYPTYETRPLGVLVNYAHNDYLQVVAENGIIGGILTILFIASIFSALRRGVRSRDRLCAAMSLAAATGILAVLIQSLSDTDLQIPSNAFLFLILTAIVCRTAQPKVALIENPTV